MMHAMFILIFAISANAGLSTRTEFRGRILSFDETHVQVNSGARRYLVPKKYFPEDMKFQEGGAVRLVLTPEQSQQLHQESRSFPDKTSNNAKPPKATPKRITVKPSTVEKAEKTEKPVKAPVIR